MAFIYKNKKYYLLLLSFILIIILIHFTRPYIKWPGKVRSDTIKESIGRKNLINLGFPINTVGDDFSPSVTADGKTMVFNSKSPGGRDHNIYITVFNDSKWTKPEFFGVLNSRENDETPFISPDGNTIIFSSDRRGSLWPPVTSDGKERITYDLYVSRNYGGKWTKPERLKGYVNTIKNERSPSLSKDNKTLYFTRWPFKKFHKVKIMQATYDNGYFEDIKELPREVNSGHYDVSIRPSMNKPGFYFSSARSGGYGGWDLYFIYYKDKKFGKAINLGPGINSTDNELFLCEAGNEVFFCSNKPSGFGLYDIYSIIIPRSIWNKYNKKKTEIIPVKKKKEKQITKKTEPEKKKPEPEKKKTEIKKKEEKPISTEKKSEKPADKTRIIFNIIEPKPIKFKVFLKDTDNPKKKALRSVTRTSSVKGEFSVLPKPDVKWVIIKIDEIGYKPIRKAVKVVKDKTINVELEIIPEKNINFKTSDFVFHLVYFNFNSSTIRLEYYPYIHSIIDYLRKNKGIRLKIIGHADLNGTWEANKIISLKRARRIRDYFVTLGLKGKRFRVIGMGEKKPVTRSTGKDFNEANRRVEFRAMK